MPTHLPSPQRISKHLLIRNLVINLLVYGVLVTLYALVVLRWLGGPLQDLFHGNLTVYALVGLTLIVVQGVVLERITSFLMARLGLRHFD